jgi:hypothetical protein
MRGYEETPVTRNPYIGLTNERDMKEYLVLKKYDEMMLEQEVNERAKEMVEESKELKRRQLEEENRRQLEEEENHLRMLEKQLRNAQTDGSDSDASNVQRVTNIEKVRQAIERRRYLEERRQRRRRGEAVDSTTSEESLTAPFRSITKV